MTLTGPWFFPAFELQEFFTDAIIKFNHQLEILWLGIMYVEIKVAICIIIHQYFLQTFWLKACFEIPGAITIETTNDLKKGI